MIAAVKKLPKSEDVICELKRLAFGKANDAVKLVFAKDAGPQAVDGLDLSLLSEVRRGSSGMIEVKLINRLEALSLLAELLRAGAPAGGESAAALFRAMDEAAQRTGGVQ